MHKKRELLLKFHFINRIRCRQACGRGVFMQVVAVINTNLFLIHFCEFNKLLF